MKRDNQLPVMLVDDEEHIRVAASQALELAGYDVRAFDRADKALAALSPDWPGAVISDIRMPRLDGLTAMERVQGEKDIPFIFVTADDESDHRNRLKQWHVLDYLQKPIRQTELSSAVASASAAIFY